MPDVPIACDILKDHNLHGRNAIVTGGAAGLGFETARSLALHGCNVRLAVRSLPAAEQAATEIKASGATGSVTVKYLDLTNLATVRQFAAEVVQTYSKIDYLICNAGVMATPFSKTADGFEVQLGTNYLGHYALVMALKPLLINQVSEARIVVMTSTSHRFVKVHLEDLNFEQRRYNGYVAYAESKLCCLLFVRELAKRLKEESVSNIKIYAVHPGIILTNLTKHRKSSMLRTCLSPLMLALVRPFSRSAEQGAATIVYGCVCQDVASGSYLENCAASEPGESALDEQVAKDLFDKTAALVGAVPVKVVQVLTTEFAHQEQINVD